MKKLFFIAAIAGAALVSCTKNELAPSATEQHELIFANPVTSTLTKVVDLATGTQYPTTAPFYVFADYHINEFSADGTPLEDVTSYMRGNNGVLVTHKTTEITINNQKYDDNENYRVIPSVDGKIKKAVKQKSVICTNAFIEYSD